MKYPATELRGILAYFDKLNWGQVHIFNANLPPIFLRSFGHCPQDEREELLLFNTHSIKIEILISSGLKILYFFRNSPMVLLLI